MEVEFSRTLTCTDRYIKVTKNSIDVFTCSTVSERINSQSAGEQVKVYNGAFNPRLGKKEENTLTVGAL